MALTIAKYIEIKTQKSIKSVIKELKRVTDAGICDEVTKNEFTMRSEISEITAEILRKI